MELTNGTETITLKIGKILDDKYLENEKSFELQITANVAFLKINFVTYSHTAVLTKLYSDLEYAYENCSGEVDIDAFSYEKDVSLKISFMANGHVNIKMMIKSNDNLGNNCSLNFMTDQTFIKSFLTELKNSLNKIQ